MPKVGEPLPLSLQLFDGATDMYVRAILRDADGVFLPESPKSLPHINDGNYESLDVLMPLTDFVTCIYQVYTDAGFTVKSINHSDATDVFPITIIDSDLIALLEQLKDLLEQIINLGVPFSKVSLLDDLKIYLEDSPLKVLLDEVDNYIVASEEETLDVNLADDFIDLHVNDMDMLSVSIKCT